MKTLSLLICFIFLIFNNLYGQKPVLTNISARTNLEDTDGKNVVILGFSLVPGINRDAGGIFPNMGVLVRAIGPGLRKYGINNHLKDPVVKLFTGSGVLISSNDNWQNTLWLQEEFQNTGSFTLSPGSKDAVIFNVLGAGNYTAVVECKPGDSGIVLVEVYDARKNQVLDMVNLSTRVNTGNGVNAPIVGFATSGNGQYLARTIGPSLKDFDVPNFVIDPSHSVVNNITHEILDINDNWDSSLAETFIKTGAFSLDENSLDAASIISTGPSLTTIVVDNKGKEGVVLMELYVIP